MSTVKLTADAKEDLRDLDGSAQKLVVKALRKLETDPSQRGLPLGSRQQGNLTGFRKLIVGDRQYRIVFQVLPDNSIVVVWVIGERADDKCYQLATARLATYRDRDAVDEIGQILQELFEG